MWSDTAWVSCENLFNMHIYFLVHIKLEEVLVLFIFFDSVGLNESVVLQRSAPSPGSPRRKSVDASSWSSRRWRPAWTSSPQETSCPASAQTLVCPNRCRWLPPSSPGRPWSSTWCPAGAPSLLLQQPFTWPPRPLQRRRLRKVSDNTVWILTVVKRNVWVQLTQIWDVFLVRLN